MDLRSDSESKSGSEQTDPNRPDYEESSSDEESEAENSEAGETETSRPPEKPDIRVAAGTIAPKKNAEQNQLGLKAAAKKKEAGASAAQPPHNPPNNETAARGAKTVTKATQHHAAPTDESRTHFGYEWTVNEMVLYNRSGKRKTDMVESLYATIVKFPQKLPASDNQAMVWINLVTAPTLEPVCVKVQSLEKATKTERRELSSTIQMQQSLPGTTTIDIGSSDEETRVAGNTKRKADPRSPVASSKKPKKTGGYVENVVKAARVASKPIDNATKEAFRILLLATVGALDAPELADILEEKDQLQRRHQKLQTAQVKIIAQLEEKEKALGEAVKAGKTERARRKKCEAQIEAQKRALEDQAATAAEENKAATTRELAESKRRCDELEKQIAGLKAQMRTHKDQAAEAATAEAQELAKTKLQNNELSDQVTGLKKGNKELQDRITLLQAKPGLTDGVAQGGAEGEQEPKAELEKALADRSAELADVKQQLETIRALLLGEAK
jgi:hypothetical protein